MKKAHFAADAQKLTRRVRRTFFVKASAKTRTSKLLFAINDSLEIEEAEKETFENELKTKQKKLNEVNELLKNEKLRTTFSNSSSTI